MRGQIGLNFVPTSSSTDDLFCAAFAALGICRTYLCASLGDVVKMLCLGQCREERRAGQKPCVHPFGTAAVPLPASACHLCQPLRPNDNIEEANHHAVDASADVE